MKGNIFIIVAVLFLFAACGPVSVNKPDKLTTIADSASQVKAETVVQPAPDSTMLAYGSLYFGMKKAEVERKNEPRQKLGKYEYGFDYSFNGDSALYRVTIKSNGVKVIGYDTDLIAYYRNLAQIVETRYGKPAEHSGLPSVFDVQNSGRFLIDRWSQGSKQIDIVFKENALNSYSVLCEITHNPMAEAETVRLKSIKNKDVNEAAKKF